MWFFTQAAFVTFGGAYAVLSYIADGAVNGYGWLTASEMVRGLGLTESTPGPLIMVTEYVGFIAAWKTAPADIPRGLYATLGALITVYATFLRVRWNPLRFRPRAQNPSTGWVFLQTGLALGAVFLGSQVFVAQLEKIATAVGVPGHIMALLLSPVATELPETMNALIWVRQGKERLALATSVVR
jgi:hypothetical protein